MTLHLLVPLLWVFGFCSGAFSVGVFFRPDDAGWWTLLLFTLLGAVVVAWIVGDERTQRKTILPPRGRSVLRSPSDYEQSSQTLNWPS